MLPLVTKVVSVLYSNPVAIVITLVTCWFAFICLQKKNCKFPPGPNGIPILGVALSIGLRPEITFRDWSKIYGDVIGFKVGNSCTVVLNSYEEIQDALVRHGSIFNNRPKNPIFTADLLKTGITASDFSKDYIIQRKFYHRALAKLGFGKTMMEDSIMDEAQRLVKMLGEGTVEVDRDAKLFQEKFMFAIGNVVAKVAFGKRFSDIQNPDFVVIREALHAFFHTGALAFNAASISPWLLFIPKIRRSANAITIAMNKYRDTLWKILREHREAFDPDNPKDFIDEYFVEQQKNGELYTDKTLVAAVVDIFGGGTETTTLTLIFSLLILANRPHIVKKVHEEIDAVLGPDGKPHFALREKMPFCHAVIREVLRFRSTAPLLVPHAVLEDVVYKGYEIPKGSTVICNVYAVHNNPAHWDRPDEFDPDRFIKNGKVEIGKYYIPFGIGPRRCIGRALAEMELFIFFVTLLQHFDVVPTPQPGSKRPSVFDDVDFTGITINLPKHIPITLVSRHGDR